MSQENESQEAAVRRINERVAESLDAEIFAYNGPLLEPFDDEVIQVLCTAKGCRPNVALVLATYGGSAHAAYRFGRCLQRHFGRITLFIDGPCMSAGTLVAIGAHEIVLSDHGILSPLDVQVRKPDELGEMSSGLTMDQAMYSLQAQAFSLFESNLLELKVRSGGQITLKTAMEIAARLTTGLLEPIYAQIDPMRLGEDSRSMKIAEEYGRRLDDTARNLKIGALDRLVAGYPSHIFAIDETEARGLFERVRAPTEEESALLDTVPSRTPATDGPRFAFLPSQKEEDDHAQDTELVRSQTEGGREDSEASPSEAEGALSSFPNRKRKSRK